MNEITGPTKQLQSIQLFRGIAAILVLLHHVTGFYSTTIGYNYLGGIFLPGWSGVDFFFCLSGFIIYYISHEDIGDPSRVVQFSISRITRIYPIVWIVTMSLIPIYFLFPQFGIGYERDPVVILKSLLLLPQMNNPILGVAWTLSYEILFYTIFGLFIYFGKRLVAPFIITWLVVILLKFCNILTFDNYLLKFFFSGHNLEFLLGCISAHIVVNNHIQKQGIFIIIGLMGFVISWILTINGLLTKSSAFSILGYGISSTFLIVGSSSFELSRKLCAPKQLIILGDASYSIYLIHAPLISLMFKIFVSVHVMDYLGYFFTATVTWILALLLGCLFHYRIEKPLQIYLRKRLSNYVLDKRTGLSIKLT